MTSTIIKGKFITLEDIDGAGKSTHAPLIAQWLNEQGIQTITTRELGGSNLGEELRKILLHQPMNIASEVLLIFASSCQHVTETILPALHDGFWVVSDRFIDSSFAYQGGGNQFSINKLFMLEQWINQQFYPDLTLLFDLPVDVALNRIKDVEYKDKFEKRDKKFFTRVWASYLQRASEFHKRIKVINANQPIKQVSIDIEKCLVQLLDSNTVTHS